MKLLKKYKERHAFNADNCRKKQQRIQDEDYLRKIEDIQGRIDFVINNSNDEHAVIYHVKPCEIDLYDRVIEFFYSKGFYTVKTKIEGLDDEYLIISW